MNDDLGWVLDVTVIEWMIVFATMVVLTIVGILATRQSLKAFRKLNGQHADSIFTPENWHSQSTRSVFESLETNANGLSKEEAINRLAQYGQDRLHQPKARGPIERFFNQFYNVLIYVLMAAGVVTAMLGHWVDASDSRCCSY